MPPPTPPMPTSLKQSLESTKVEYAKLGSSGLRVSVPILGAMSIGSKEWASWVIEEEEGMELLKHAYDRGMNTWDTANMYSNGISQEIIGKAIKKFDIPREKIVILDKVFATTGEDIGLHTVMFPAEMTQSKDYVNQGGLSRTAIFKAVDKALKRLGTDYIDLLQIHRYDRSVRPEETMKALHDLVESGKVHYIGASSMWTYQFASLQFIAEKNGWTKFISMQNCYSLLYREEEREMIKFCNETGVGLIHWSPNATGKLAKPWAQTDTLRSQSKGGSGPLSFTTEADKTIIERVEEISGKKGWSMSQVALVWIRHKHGVPIVGLSKPGRVDEASDIRDKKLTDEEIEYLEEPYVPKAIMGHR